MVNTQCIHKKSFKILRNPCKLVSPMSQLRSIASNTIVQMIGRVVGTVFGILTIAVMTRALGTDGYGQFTLAFTFLAVAGALVDFGFTLTTTQMISEKGADESKIVSNAFTARLISGIIFFGLAVLLAWFMPYETIVKITIAVGAFSFFFMTNSQMLIGVFQKHMAMWRPALAEAVSRGLILLLVVWLATTTFTVAHMMAAFAIGNLLLFAINFGLAQRLARIRLAFDASLMKRFFSRSWPIAISIFFNLLYLKGDIIFLDLYRTSSEVGLYGAAYKVLDVVTVIPSMFMGLMLPLLVGYWTQKARKDFNRILQQSFDFFALLALPMLGGTLVLAGPIMELVAGPEFFASGQYLVILMLANTIVFFGILFGHTVVAINKQRFILPAYFLTAAVAIALYLVTIPKHGAFGAAWTTVISEAMITLMTMATVLYFAKFRPKFKSTLVSLFCAATMTSLVYLFVASLEALTPLFIFIAILIGAAYYAFSVLVLGGVKLSTVKEIIGARKHAR